MKLIFTILFGIIFSLNLLAQPSTITYQGKLLDNSGLPLNSNSVTLTFAIYDAATNGNKVWPASGVVSKNVAVNFGLYSVTLGTGVGNDDTFTASNLSGSALYLEVNVAGNPLPRTLLTTVPYAVVAKELADWSNQPIVPSGFMISSTSSTAPSGYTYTGLVTRADSISWSEKATMTTARRQCAAAIGPNPDNIFVMGGYNGSQLNVNEMYNPYTNTWTTKASMPVAARGIGLEMVNGKIYALMGYNGQGTDSTAYEYDPVANTWSTKAHSTKGSASSFGTAVVNDKIYCVGGSSGGDGQFSGVASLAFVYTPASNQWDSIKINFHGFSYFWFNGTQAVSYGNKVYFLGGRFDNGKAMVEYDPITKAATDYTDVPNLTNYHAMEIIGDKIFCIGGTTSYGVLGTNTALSFTQVFDINTKSWGQRQSLPTPVLAPASVVQGNKIYLFGGSDGASYSNKVQVMTFEGKDIFFHKKN